MRIPKKKRFCTVLAVTERESLVLGPMAGDRRTSASVRMTDSQTPRESLMGGGTPTGAHEISQPGPWERAEGKRSRKNFHRFLFGKGANRPAARFDSSGVACTSRKADR